MATSPSTRLPTSSTFRARYIQKLFQQAGMSFSQYVRRRRLEHCYADLGSLAHRNLSISDICFRWGFNDAAISAARSAPTTA